MEVCNALHTRLVLPRLLLITPTDEGRYLLRELRAFGKTHLLQFKGHMRLNGVLGLQCQAGRFAHYQMEVKRWIFKSHVLNLCQEATTRHSTVHRPSRISPEAVFEPRCTLPLTFGRSRLISSRVPAQNGFDGLHHVDGSSDSKNRRPAGDPLHLA